MKRIITLLLFLQTVLSVSPQIKIMSYNIRNAKGMDEVRDCQRIATVILRDAPDIVALQEVDSVTTRSGQTYVLGELAALTGMHGSFAPAIDFQNGKYGVGILSKKRPIRATRLCLPGNEEKRVLLATEFEHFIFCSTHLSLTEADRMTSLDIIRNFANQQEKPVFIAGDLNDTPGSSTLTALQKHFQVLTPLEQPTFPSTNPRTTLDYIAVTQKHQDAIEIITKKVINEPMASDHLPVIVEIRLLK